MQDRDDVEIARIERDRLRLLVAADVDAARALHADDFQLVTPSGRTLSKGEYLERVGSGGIDYRRWEAGEIVVRRYGEAAVLRYPAEMDIAAADGPIVRIRLWHTDLYERRDGRWQVVWSHATQVDD